MKTYLDLTWEEVDPEMVVVSTLYPPAALRETPPKDLKAVFSVDVLLSNVTTRLNMKEMFRKDFF